MLTVSLHGIKITAPHGLYVEEHILANQFEIDVDVHVPAAMQNTKWPFIDYTLIQKTVADTFLQKDHLLEDFVRHIHTSLSKQFPVADKIRVAIRKLHPPMHGDIAYAQVCYEG